MNWNGRRALSVLAVLIIAAGGAYPARGTPQACLALVRLADGGTLYEATASEFALTWRHSVTLTPVQATYAIVHGSIRQVEERFSEHGPGMAFDGTGWRHEGQDMVLPLDRPIPRLVLRSAPEHENRLIAGGRTTDLTLWPGQPLEILARPCKDTDR